MVASPPLPKDVSKVPSALYHAATKSPFTYPAVRSLPSGRATTSVSPGWEDPKLLKTVPPYPNVGSRGSAHSMTAPVGQHRSSSASTLGRKPRLRAHRTRRFRVSSEKTDHMANPL